MENSNGKFFPLFISLNEEKIIFIGGGKIAERRIKVLLEFGASITVIAPEVTEEINSLNSNGKLKVKKRSFQKNDTDGAFIVCAATDNKNLNRQIYEECKEKNITVNIASEWELCDFFFPAIINTEDITIGVCGNGENHKQVKVKADEIRNKLRGCPE